MTFLFHLHTIYEEIHPSIQRALNMSVPKKVLEKTYDAIGSLHNTGEESGLNLKTRKDGSSRTVFDTTEPKNIVVDNQPVNLKTVVKIVHENPLDMYNDTGDILGIHQNKREANEDLIKAHSVLTPIGNNSYKTNKKGVFAPVVSVSNRFNSLEMAKVEPFNHEDFERYTADKNNPTGLHHYGVLRVIHGEIDGDESHRKSMGDRYYNSVLNHPFTQRVIKAVKESGLATDDLGINNWGIFEHPVTKERIPVISDYGMTPELAQHYKNFQKKYHHN